MTAGEAADARFRPLVAIGYGPRCVPVMDLVAAATGLCDLLWLIDGSLPVMAEMADLLGRFGPVIDVSGLDPAGMADAVSSDRPDALTTYLDAGMVGYAGLAQLLGVPFHTPATAEALIDKARQRAALREAGLPTPDCHIVPPGPGAAAVAQLGPGLQWPLVLKPRSAQGSRYTFLASDPDHAAHLLDALGPGRSEMVMETYLADDPRRSDGPYAGYVSVESLVSDGAVSHLALTGRFPLAENFRETGFFIPAVLSASDRAETLETATRAIEALGVRFGCLHTEVKFTPEGPRIIEVNGRVGGGVQEMLTRAAGVGLLELSLRIALGEPVRVDGPVPTQRVGYRFFLQPPAVTARVGEIDGIDAVAEYPGVDGVSVHQRPGAGFDWRDGSRNHIISVVGSAQDHAEMLVVDRLLHQEVTVTYSEVSH